MKTICLWCGKPRQRKSLEERFWSKVDKKSQAKCWPWTGSTDSRGYGKICTETTYGKEVYRGAHRVSFQIHNGFLPSEVCHSCDNPPCVNPGHLFAGDRKANVTDMHLKGRGRSKLKPNDVSAIRKAIKAGKMAVLVAEEYGIARVTVHQIASGRLWKNLKESP